MAHEDSCEPYPIGLTRSEVARGLPNLVLHASNITVDRFVYVLLDFCVSDVGAVLETPRYCTRFILILSELLNLSCKCAVIKDYVAPFESTTTT